MNDSRRIHEARGLCWHEAMGGVAALNRCKYCMTPASIPNLTARAIEASHIDYRARENYADLMDAVREICDTDEKQDAYCDSLEREVSKNPYRNHDFGCYTSPQDAIVDALLGVIGGSDA